MSYRLSAEQRKMLGDKFGTYRTQNWGHLLEREAFHWLAEQDNLDTSISWGDAHVGTSVSFEKEPIFTAEQVKFLQS